MKNKDTYKNFKSLSAVEKEGIDFQIWFNKIKSPIAIIAPHGGYIEPGTSEIAISIAGDDFACYSFEGIKPKGNKKYLHITSTNFDEPEGVEICRNSDIVLAVHGARENDHFVYVGGRNEDIKNRIIEKLKNDGFNAKEDSTDHSGRDARNICNKCKSTQGLQLEISEGLRKEMFMGLDPENLKLTTDVFDKFVNSIRFVLYENATKDNSRA
jgi:phage replication-related protein YjqB (UPF0714/DUF867 family)